MRDIQSTSFFKFIYNTFGTSNVKLLKEWKKHRFNIYKCKLRIRFIKFCIQHEIIPAHLNSILHLNVHLFDHKLKSKVNDIKINLANRLLKIEINDAHRSINYFRNRLFYLARNITKNLPLQITNKFFDYQERNLYTLFIRDRNRIDRRCNWLIYKRDSTANKNIKPLRYYWVPSDIASLSSDGFSSSGKNKKFSLSKPSFDDRSNIIEINISPSSFKDPLPSFSSLHSTKKNWFLNLSNLNIPPLIQHFLQLGDNFSFPNNNKKQIIMESIKDIENNIKRFQIPNQNIIRNRSIPIINSYTSWSSKKHWFDSELQNLEKSTNVFLTKNPDLLLTKADKGNITVAFEKTEYVNKINQMLLDKDTYSTLAINPMNKIVNSIKGLLTRWKKMEYISLATYRNLYCSDGILPRAYGLPKVHKPDCPFRIIISSIDSPLYSLANFLHNIINKGMPKAKTHINNSFLLLKILSGLKLENETCLII